MYASQSIAEKLLENGVIDSDQFSEARAESLKRGLSVEDLLQSKGIITGLDIAKAKSEIYDIPFVDLSDMTFESSVFSYISADIARRQNAVPFRETQTALDIAMKDPLDIQSVNYLSKLIG